MALDRLVESPSLSRHGDSAAANGEHDDDDKEKDNERDGDEEDQNDDENDGDDDDDAICFSHTQSVSSRYTLRCSIVLFNHDCDHTATVALAIDRRSS